MEAWESVGLSKLSRKKSSDLRRYNRHDTAQLMNCENNARCTVSLFASRIDGSQGQTMIRLKMDGRGREGGGQRHNVLLRMQGKPI
jgi:hypothetical protein